MNAFLFGFIHRMHTLWGSDDEEDEEEGEEEEGDDE